MATPELAPSRPGAARRLLRWLAVLALLVVLLAAALGAWCYRTASAALPQLDGSLRLTGLTAPVAVTRDTQGVPTIEDRKSTRLNSSHVRISYALFCLKH